MTAQTALRIEIKKLKTFRGMEGMGYNCEVWIDGKKAGSCTDDAHGGALRFEHDWNKETLARLDAYATSLPPIPFGAELGGGTYQPDADHVIAKAVDEHDFTKKAKRWIKSGKVVVRDGDEVFTYKAPLTDALRAKIAKDSKPGYAILNDDPAFKV